MTPSKRLRIGEILVEWGLITAAQLSEALRYQNVLGESQDLKKRLDMDDAGIIMGICRFETLLHKLDELGIVSTEEVEHDAEERFIIWEETFPTLKS